MYYCRRCEGRLFVEADGPVVIETCESCGAPYKNHRTIGQWHLAVRDDKVYITSGSSELVAAIGPRSAKSLANGALLACSPELLTELRFCAKMLWEIASADPRNSDELNVRDARSMLPRIQALIVRAEGLERRAAIRPIEWDD